MSDGNLRQLFQKHLPAFHWQAVETGSTGRGIPDLNYCVKKKEGWIENKTTDAWSPEIFPEQVGWAERRKRAGGRIFLAVRRLHSGGPRKGPSVDELWLFDGALTRTVKDQGLKGLESFALGIWGNQPEDWDWLAIQALLI